VNTILVLRDLLQALAARGKTIFYSSHILDIVEKICSRVLIIRGGRIVADDSIDHLRERMREPSLENIFARITEEQKHAEVAAGILEAIET
jgi:ABC-2 type transport system ATP-binding protein